jgi:2-keto-4-pentenoate hydratase/2-oxohepta-3-ene-1,7-dioic acid hydratase in catechol pathway
MKLANFHRPSSGEIRCGLVVDDVCIDLKAAQGAVLELPTPVSTVEDLLRIDSGVAMLAEQLGGNGTVPAALDPFRIPLADVRLTAPILNPQKLIGIGFNYRDHAEETATQVADEPVFFGMFASAITGPFDPIIKPATTQMLDYEAELAVVIGKKGRCVPVERALEHVAGYTVFDDVSARNFQMSDSQWLRVKSHDSFAPMGPWLVTADELADGSGLDIECRVNGEVRQKSNTRHLIFDVPHLIAYLSSVMTLHPGDVISTGTPAGVGFARSPQVFLNAGDVVEVEIEKIGALKNPVIDAA